MIRLELSEMVEAMGGVVAGGPPTISVCGVSTDSRTTGEGELFFALSGPRFDGHTFAADAVKRGAVGVVAVAPRAEDVSDAIAEVGMAGVVVSVADPLAALGRLAAFHRLQLSTDVIAVVGSNGKTTTKAMIDHILMGKLRGRCSPKSFNNEIGVPLTLLSPESQDDYLVVEIGTNAPGEVAALAELAQPRMAVITCIAEEHLEGLRDLDGVADEECSVLDHLTSGGFAAVNVDWQRVKDYLPESGVTIATFGRAEDADIRVTATRYEYPWTHFTINDRFEYRLKMPGAHNALNAAGAIAIARRWALDHDEIAERLESFEPLPMRSQVLDIAGVQVINDAYNANPGSAIAAIEALEAMPTEGRRIAVLGEMCELGARSAELHRRVAQQLLTSKIDRVVLFGEAGSLMGAVLDDARLFGPKVARCRTVAECVNVLGELLNAGDVLLLKASRAVELDLIVDPLRDLLDRNTTTPTK